MARLLYYPACPDADYADTVGIRPHSDFECFTLLLQSSCPGLEILSPEGHWIGATPIEGGIVVNVGDFLSTSSPVTHISESLRTLTASSSALDEWTVQQCGTQGSQPDTSRALQHSFLLFNQL